MPCKLARVEVGDPLRTHGLWDGVEAYANQREITEAVPAGSSQCSQTYPEHNKGNQTLVLQKQEKLFSG